MNKSTEKIIHLLWDVGESIEQSKSPSDFDLEEFFLNKGCTVRLADILSDYMPSACGRAFLKELEINVSDFYQRRLTDGSLGREQRYDSDPLWNSIESFAEEMRLKPETRKQFSLLAQQSAELDAVNKAANAGQSLDDLKGSSMGNGIFNAPLEKG